MGQCFSRALSGFLYIKHVCVRVYMSFAHFVSNSCWSWVGEMAQVVLCWCGEPESPVAKVVDVSLCIQCSRTATQ